MTTSSTSTDWIREGAEVAEYDGRGYDPSVIAFTTIDRLTATQIVLANGRRYNRAKLARVGEDHYKSPKLLPANDQQVRDTEALRVFHRIANDIYTQDREFRGGEAAVLAAFDQIEQAVGEARAAISGTSDRDRLARHLYATALGGNLRRSGEQEWDSGTAKPDDVQDCYTRADVLLAAMTGKEA